ncbi:hypothetical protein HK097_007783 [Rhizophlyctis rosea]|uniref:Uncharacterized protein n=1 Tax=Rhizophlyctis rosea TaxID=64517 RepID=A0AAD5SII3_9FUNG|nr:hypothetical protein HK097_007783 [Rhizophlyctis rosea]
MTVATSVGNRALETRIGKRVQATYGTVKENVIELALDTQDILEEKQQAASPLDMEPVDGLEQEDEAIDLS